MSDASTKTFEQEFRELQKKYIDLTMSAKLRELEIKHWQAECKHADRERYGYKHRMEAAERVNESLENQIECDGEEMAELKNLLRVAQREIRGLRSKSEREGAEVTRGQERIKELAQMISDFTGMEVDGRKEPEIELEGEVEEDEDDWVMRKEEWEVRQEELEREQREKEFAGGDGVW